MDLAQHAANDSAVEPLKMNSEGSGTGGSAQQEASQLIKNGQQYQGTVDDWFTNLGDDRQRIEAVTNHVELWSTFGNTPLMDDDRLGEELPQLALALGECWQGVLSTRHPDREITVEVSDEEDGSYGPTVTFWTSPSTSPAVSAFGQYRRATGREGRGK